MHTHSPKNRHGYTPTTKIGQTPTYPHTHIYLHLYGYEEDILSAICNIKNKLAYGQKLYLGQAAREGILTRLYLNYSPVNCCFEFFLMNHLRKRRLYLSSNDTSS